MMRTKEQVKREILAAIDRRAEQIIGLGEQIGRHPELGFKEIKTARLVEETSHVVDASLEQGFLHEPGQIL